MQKTIHSEPYRALLDWLKTRRKARGLSMRALAERLNVSHTWVGKVEQAERRLDIAEYARLCDALGINPREGLDLLSAAIYDARPATRRKSLKIAAEQRARYPAH